MNLLNIFSAMRGKTFNSKLRLHDLGMFDVPPSAVPFRRRFSQFRFIRGMLLLFHPDGWLTNSSIYRTLLLRAYLAQCAFAYLTHTQAQRSIRHCSNGVEQTWLRHNPSIFIEFLFRLWLVRSHRKLYFIVHTRNTRQVTIHFVCTPNRPASR